MNGQWQNYYDILINYIELEMKSDVLWERKWRNWRRWDPTTTILASSGERNTQTPSSVWAEADIFMPDRFLDRKIELRGKDFQLIPFGTGRRICPGLPLAYRMVRCTSCWRRSLPSLGGELKRTQILIWMIRLDLVCRNPYLSRLFLSN